MATDSQNRSVSGVGLPPEVVEDILAAPRRRAVLECLADAEDGLVMDELVKRVIDREGSDVEGEKYERVRANIYDDHLPKLTATGVVTYDSMRECVALATPTIIDHIDG
jgi:hypothetical protein